MGAGALTLLMCLQRKGTRPVGGTDGLDRYQVQARWDRFGHLNYWMTNFILVVDSPRQQRHVELWDCEYRRC